MERRFALVLFRFFPFGFAGTFLHRFGFGHVLTLFGLAVVTRTFLVINFGIGVHPHPAVTAAWFRCCFGNRLGRRACGWRGAIFRFKQATEYPFCGRRRWACSW